MAKKIENGLSDFADDLKAISEVVTDEKVHEKALLAGAMPVVNHAALLAPRGKTGRLAQSIGAQYSETIKAVRVGIGEPVSTSKSATGFYGRFQNDGWRPAVGRRVATVSGKGGRALDKRSKSTSGKVKGKHFLGTAMDAQENNAFGIIIDELKKELEGVGTP